MNKEIGNNMNKNLRTTNATKNLTHYNQVKQKKRKTHNVMITGALRSDFEQELNGH